MTVQESIEEKLLGSFDPAYLEVVNESHAHNVPPGSETHFKVVLVSDRFEGQRLVPRHRMVNHALAEELAGPVHALALHTHTRAEWEQRFGQVPESPVCLGGKAREQ